MSECNENIDLSNCTSSNKKEMQSALMELQKTATGQQEWQAPSNDGATAASSGQLAHLLQPRSSTPLSYWDWRIWTMARPTLWRFGDAANLYTDREVPLTVAICRFGSLVLQRDGVLSCFMKLSFVLRQISKSSSYSNTKKHSTGRARFVGSGSDAECGRPW